MSRLHMLLFQYFDWIIILLKSLLKVVLKPLGRNFFKFLIGYGKLIFHSEYINRI